MKKIVVGLVVLAALVAVPSVMAQECDPLVDVDCEVEEVDDEDVAGDAADENDEADDSDATDEDEVEECDAEEDDCEEVEVSIEDLKIVSTLLGIAKKFVSTYALQVIFMIGTVAILGYVGFIKPGDQTRIAVIFSGVAAAGLGATAEAYPAAAPWIELAQTIYVLVVAAPTTYEVGIGVKDMIAERVAARNTQPQP